MGLWHGYKIISLFKFNRKECREFTKVFDIELDNILKFMRTSRNYDVMDPYKDYHDI